MFYSMSMVFLSMLHHFNYPELKYYIYSNFSFHLNLLAVCNCNRLFILIQVLLLRPTQLKSIFSYYDTFTFVFMKVHLYYATAAHLEMSTNR